MKARIRLAAITLTLGACWADCQATGAASPTGPANALPTASVATPPTAPVGGLPTAPANPASMNVCTETRRSAALYHALDALAARETTRVVTSAQFLTAGERVRFVLARPYEKDAVYRAFVQRDPQGTALGQADTSALLTDGAVLVQQPSAKDPLVTSGEITSAEATAISAELPPFLESLWHPGRVYLFACKGDHHDLVSFVSVVSAPLSPHRLSLVIAVAFVVICYVLAAIAVSIIDRKQKGTRAAGRTWLRYLDPVVLTAGTDGKGSASKLQILFFSCVVVGILSFVILRTGILSNVSGTILTLLGISAVGAAASKATDTSRNRLDSQNWAWLIQKHWLPKNGLVAVNTAQWRDIVTTDGEFDVYRFQMLMFSVLVAGALLVTPWENLALFEVPTNLLGILGLSQVVYIGGKLVAPPSLADLDSALTELRKRETAFRSAATTNPDPTLPLPAPGAHLPPPTTLAEAVRRASQLAYTAYMEQARLVQKIFEAVTDQTVQPADLEPGFV